MELKGLPSKYKTLYRAAIKYLEEKGGSVAEISGVSVIKEDGRSYMLAIKLEGEVPDFAVERTHCGHPKSRIVSNGTTAFCRDCEAKSREVKIDFSINDFVKCELTDYGKEMIARRGFEPDYIQGDVIKIQLWQLMHYLGDAIFNGAEQSIVNNKLIIEGPQHADNREAE